MSVRTSSMSQAWSLSLDLQKPLERVCSSNPAREIHWKLVVWEDISSWFLTCLSVERQGPQRCCCDRSVRCLCSAPSGGARTSQQCSTSGTPALQRGSNQGSPALWGAAAPRMRRELFSAPCRCEQPVSAALGRSRLEAQEQLVQLPEPCQQVLPAGSLRGGESSRALPSAAVLTEHPPGRAGRAAGEPWPSPPGCWGARAGTRTAPGPKGWHGGRVGIARAGRVISVWWSVRYGWRLVPVCVRPGRVPELLALGSPSWASAAPVPAALPSFISARLLPSL